MKNKFLKVMVIIAVLASLYAAGAALAIPVRWVENKPLEDNSATVAAWVKVAAVSSDGFDDDEEYLAAFIVTQWAENGNYKLVLSGIEFFNASRENKDPDGMWEYFTAGGVWVPISQAKNLELIPSVTVNSNIAILAIRVKPGFFRTPGFAEYLDYTLELTAKLVKK